MKVVAVSQREDQLNDRNEIRDALDQRLITFLLEAGFIPVPVPNKLYKALSDGLYDWQFLNEWLEKVKPQAFLLSGGNNIGQCIERDLTEVILLDHAKSYRLPLLGICRGMQMMARWAGTSLKPVQGHVRTRHHLSGEIVGEVNSYHHFSLADCPENFKVLARSEDGEIEAIGHVYLPWEGWMWHLEREEKFAQRDLKRVVALFGR